MVIIHIGEPYEAPNIVGHWLFIFSSHIPERKAGRYLPQLIKQDERRRLFSLTWIDYLTDEFLKFKIK